MKISILYCLGFIALLAVQMAHPWLVVGGLVVSLGVLLIAMFTMAFYSFKKFTVDNAIPETAERIIAWSVMNLVTMWAYFLISGGPLSVKLRDFVDKTLN